MLNNLDPDQGRQKSGLIWVQIVFKVYQQTTLEGKVLFAFVPCGETPFLSVSKRKANSVLSQATVVLNVPKLF